MGVVMTSTQAAGAASTIYMIVMLVIMFALMYFLMIRPQKKEQKRVTAMLNDMEVGDAIVTTGGFYGVIIDITDEDVDINNDEDIEDTDDDGGLEINLFKYELIKICIDRVLYEGEDIDEKMGGFGSNTPMSFKIAFNTLIKNQILISEDDE